MLLSVIAITGLGGKKLSEKHAVETGKVLSFMNPEYIGILTLMIVEGTKLAEEYKKGNFELVDEKGILEELKYMVANLNVTNCIFRANHASNYLPIGGTLPQDKEDIVDSIDKILKDSEFHLRPEWMRGL